MEWGTLTAVFAGLVTVYLAYRSGGNVVRTQLISDLKDRIDMLEKDLKETKADVCDLQLQNVEKDQQIKILKETMDFRNPELQKILTQVSEHMRVTNALLQEFSPILKKKVI